MSRPFALYVHIPWCRHVCGYCDFNRYASSAPPEADYVRGVLAELAVYAARAPWAGRPAHTLYLGGGTPSLLSPAAVGALLGGVRDTVGLTAGAEVTLEANPGTVTRASLAGYRAAGVNRLSLGAASFQPLLLRTLGRDHTPGDIHDAVRDARAADFENFGLDIVFAVPGETLADWEADLATTLALAPAHVSAYALTWAEGTPFHVRRARGQLRPVDDDLEAAMLETAIATLEAAGHARYEVSSFARPGFASRHNTHYWDGSDYLGLGAGAHSFSRTPGPSRRWVNERRPERYLAAVRERGTAVASEERLSEAEARAEFCFTGLRRTAGIDTGEFHRRFGLALPAAFPHVAGLVADGLLEADAERLRLTPRGFRLADSVSATFV